MNQTPQRTLRIIGWIAVACAVLGLNFNACNLMMVLSGALGRQEFRHDMSLFAPVFITMSVACVVCYVLLGWYGVRFIRRRADRLRGFAALMLFECALFLLYVWLAFLSPNAGMGGALAASMSSGALKFQFIILFPLWAPFLAFRAGSRVQQSSSGHAPISA